MKFDTARTILSDGSLGAAVGFLILFFATACITQGCKRLRDRMTSRGDAHPGAVELGPVRGQGQSSRHPATHPEWTS